MTKTAFEKIKAGLEDAIAITEGRAEPGTFRVHIPESVDVKALRKSLNLTQAEFANRYGFTLGAVRDWEQSRATPEAPTRAYLKAIGKEPEVIARALEDA